MSEEQLFVDFVVVDACLDQGVFGDLYFELVLDDVVVVDEFEDAGELAFAFSVIGEGDGEDAALEKGYDLVCDELSDGQGTF